MFTNLSAPGILWIFLGLLLALYGIYIAAGGRISSFAGGLFLLGVGSVFCGLTNGFTDRLAVSRASWKGGILAFLIGLLLVAYNVYKFIR